MASPHPLPISSSVHTPKPLIGVTSSELSQGEAAVSPAYLHALSNNGVLPVLLPLSLTCEDCSRLAELLDGILFTGGPDLHPFLFGEETLTGCGSQSALRDRTELLLFSAIYKQKKPILAICRGIQLINLALGGDIWQDIDAQTCRTLPIAHRQPFDPSVPSHHVTLTGGSLLASLTGSCRIEVNSAHHQAIRRPAPCLKVCGLAPDGIIEAVELPDYPFLIGVQWHPELLLTTQAHAKNLFSAFTACCRCGRISSFSDGKREIP